MFQNNNKKYVKCLKQVEKLHNFFPTEDNYNFMFVQFLW